MRYAAECPRAARVPVVCGEAAHLGLQRPYELVLRHALAVDEDGPVRLGEERLDGLPRRLDYELAVVLAEVPPEEVEAVRDVRDERLLLGQLQPALNTTKLRKY